MVTYLRKQYPSGGFVSIKGYSENNEKSRVGVFVIPDKGIIIFKLMEDEIPFDLVCSSMFENLVKSQYEQTKEYYINKFLQSKSLCHFAGNKGKLLKYPFRFVLVYQNIALERKSDAERLKRTLKNKDIYFKNFATPFDNNALFSSFENYAMPFTSIPTDVHGLIVERVIPEYATLVRIMPNEKMVRSVGHHPQFRPITGESAPAF